MTDNNKMIKPFIEWLESFAKNHTEIEKIVLYGSFARGDATHGSDIDLVFFVCDPKEWPKLSEMIRENANTLRGLDLICFQNAPNKLKQKIQKEGVTIFERRKNKTKSA
jgi:predicted nucleotidyltransferase